MKNQLHMLALHWARQILETAFEACSVLIYDQHGAHQSAAGAVLLLALSTKDWTVEQATEFVRLLRPIVYICRTNLKFVTECLEMAKGQGGWDVFLRFQQPKPWVGTSEEFQSQAG